MYKNINVNDSQKIKKKTKIPRPARVTNEWWNSQKQLSGPIENKEKINLIYVSSSLISHSIGLYSKVDVVCNKNGVLIIRPQQDNFLFLIQRSGFKATQAGGQITNTENNYTAL